MVHSSVPGSYMVYLPLQREVHVITPITHMCSLKSIPLASGSSKRWMGEDVLHIVAVGAETSYLHNLS